MDDDRISAATCFLCAKTLRSTFRMPGKGQTCNNTQDDAMTNRLEEKCLISLCQILRIPTGHPASHVLLSTAGKSMNCAVCEQRIQSLDFTLQTITKLQDNILSVRQLMVENLLSKSANLNRHETADGRQTSQRSSSYSSHNDKEFFVLLDKVLEQQSAWTEVDFLSKTANGEASRSFVETKNLNLEIKEEIVSLDDLIPLEEPSLSPQWFAPLTDPLEIPDHFMQSNFDREASRSPQDFPDNNSDSEESVSRDETDWTMEKEGKNDKYENQGSTIRRKRKYGTQKERRETSFNCKDCGKLFNGIHALKRHENVHRREEHLKTNGSCSFCGMWLPNEELESHESQHKQREQPFSCLICQGIDVKFLGATQLKFHMKQVHPGECLSISNHQKYKCKHCEQEFLLKKLRNEHLKEVHGDLSKEHSCDICGRKFDEQYLLVLHKKNMHTSPLEYQNYQKQVESDERDFKCATCDKAFKTNRALKKHEKIHAGQEFKCPDCPKVFSTQRYLQQHGRVHLAVEQRKYYKETSS